MPNLLIIADDLTGAADCGVVFAESGMEAMVVLARHQEHTASPGGWPEADVLAIDAGTRHLGPEQAAQVIRRMVHRYDGQKAHSGLLFKKIDSTLRGNVAAELTAALEARRASASERVVILFAPAFPAHGRTTVNGRQMVNGEPLEETEFRHGSGDRPQSNIAAVMGAGGLSCELAGLATVRAGTDALRSALLRMAGEADVLICDAETDDDLQAIASAGMTLDKSTVWAGSAGLARHIPLAAGFARDFGVTRLTRPRVNGPILFVVGSSATASQDQARALSAAPGITWFRVGKAQPAPATITQHLADGEDVLLQLDSSAVEHDRLLADWLARAVKPCAQYLGALLATGGETARAILDTCGIDRLRLLGEVEPGLPYSVAECGGRELLVQTKAGGFGGPDTMLRCREFVHNLPIDSAIVAPATREMKKS
jgi:uncharacterized protein YgbK (DUF1537 family)